MKKHCLRSVEILEYLDGDLSESKRREFKSHISHCPFCQQELSEYRILERNLVRRRRPKPSEALLRNYHQNLAHQFGRKSPALRLTGIRQFLFLPTPAVRLARVMIILLIGVSLGWFLSRRTVSPDRPPAPGFQLPREAVTQINNYFLESEMWLLDVMNLSKNGAVDSDDWDLTQGEAQQLLRKTMAIRELISFDDLRLTGYFNELEMLLRELINSPEVDRSETLKQIRQTITELNLQLRTGILQEEMSVS
jgi:hypothetical protein